MQEQIFFWFFVQLVLDVLFVHVLPVSLVYVLLIDTRLLVFLYRSLHKGMALAVLILLVLPNVDLLQLVDVVHLLHGIFELPAGANVLDCDVGISLVFLLEVVFETFAACPASEKILEKYRVLHDVLFLHSLCSSNKASAQDHNYGLIGEFDQLLAVEALTSTNYFANFLDDPAHSD